MCKDKRALAFLTFFFFLFYVIFFVDNAYFLNQLLYCCKWTHAKTKVNVKTMKSFIFGIPAKGFATPKEPTYMGSETSTCEVREPSREESENSHMRRVSGWSIRLEVEWEIHKLGSSGIWNYRYKWSNGSKNFQEDLKYFVSKHKRTPFLN